MQYLLEVNDLCKKYGKRIILDNVSFRIRSGEIVGLVGRNGMGKTTLMKCLLGLSKTDGGVIRYHGEINFYQKNISL